MQRRTSRLEVCLRFWAVAFVLALGPYGLLFLMVGAVSLPFLAFIALVVTILFNGLQWIGHQLVFRTLFSDDERVQKFLREGGAIRGFTCRVRGPSILTLTRFA